MKGMFFLALDENNSVSGSGRIRQCIGADKFLCEYPQMNGVRLSRIMSADDMMSWMFFAKEADLFTFMETQKAMRTAQAQEGQQEDPPEDPPADPEDPPEDPPGDPEGEEGDPLDD